jgi:ProP effector
MSSPPEAQPDCADQLRQMFPALFGGAPKPIKLKIQADIQERAPGAFTKQQLSAFFRRYTLSNGYLVALTKATQRFDLDGQPAGELSDEHRQAARDELARRRERREARMAAEQQQRRERAQLLRDFERTTLTMPNFCALKGIEPEALEAALTLARQEAAEAPPAPPGQRPGRPPNRGPGGPQQRPQDRRQDRPQQDRPQQDRPPQDRQNRRPPKDR